MPMWIMTISGELERKGEFNLCLRYYFKMLDICEEILSQVIYFQRFKTVAALAITQNKKEKKWRKMRMRKLRENIDQYGREDLKINMK